ncbi:MAG: hypothetical protein JNJ83_06180 [Verrucomicrobiaceae bacterium]|nr:hypothetical protein [Verrucomicrobiaceae bacterium]
MTSEFTIASRLGDGDGNIFGMDIKAQIQYFFVHLHMWCVGCTLLGLSDRDSTSLPKHADRLLQKQPAIDERCRVHPGGKAVGFSVSLRSAHKRPAHHAFFNQPCCTSHQLALAGPQP